MRGRSAIPLSLHAKRIHFWKARSDRCSSRAVYIPGTFHPKKVGGYASDVGRRVRCRRISCPLSHPTRTLMSDGARARIFPTSKLNSSNRNMMHAKPWRNQTDFRFQLHCAKFHFKPIFSSKTFTRWRKILHVGLTLRVQEASSSASASASAERLKKTQERLERCRNSCHPPPTPSPSTTISHVLFRGAVYLFSPSRQIGPRENQLPWRSVLHSSFHSVL